MDLKCLSEVTDYPIIDSTRSLNRQHLLIDPGVFPSYKISNSNKTNKYNPRFFHQPQLREEIMGPGMVPGWVCVKKDDIVVVAAAQWLPMILIRGTGKYQ